VVEAHFHLFVMVGVITLYQDWLPFGLALADVVVHHTVLGVLARELERARRMGTGVCVAMIDLDDFNASSDRFGHQAGGRNRHIHAS
jgi:Diguanylate cyclase, GGDEF domain